MKETMRKYSVQYLIALSIIFFLSGGCRVQLVADYDENIHNEIIRIAEEIDLFYTRLLDTPVDERSYDNFKEDYLLIEVDLRSLLLQNKVRPLNEESVRQTEIAIELWLDDKENHKENNSVSDFIIKQHREQFSRIFTAMAIGESAKEE